MFDFNKPKIEITELSEDKRFGRFVVEPLERGYGTDCGRSKERPISNTVFRKRQDVHQHV